MKPIEVTKTSYQIDGKAIYLNSGEFHYFRVPRADWKKRMELFKEAGGNCLATYIPWGIHESEEGIFDFGETNPQLDLAAFLETAQEVGLYVICRPGPYQYSELVYSGLPLWLGANYPEVKGVNRHGELLSDSSSCDQISYLHPVFLEKTKTWLEKICPIISKYTVNKGGPVAFVQPDNELGGIQLWNGGYDYNPETMGFGNDKGRYPQFLLNKYSNIESINDIYGANFKDIKEVDPRKTESVGISYLMEKDYFEFYCHHMADYLEFLIDVMESSGIDVSFVHNSANPNMNSNFMETVDRLGDKLVIGSDHYYNLNPRWEYNNPTPQYAIKTLFSNEMLRLYGFPPTIFELPGGSLSNWPPITPQDLNTCYLTNVALGMKGHNYYIFTGGPNVKGTGVTSDIYDFAAPIGPDGEIRPTYKTLKEFGHFLQNNEWMVDAEREHDLQISMPWEYTRAQNYAVPCSKLEESANSTWQFVREGLMTTALCADISPAFCNLDSDNIDLGKALYVPSCSYLERASQERVVDLLKKGATIMMGPTLPLLDEFFKPCTIIADYLRLSNEFKITANTKATRACTKEITNIMNTGALYLSENIPDSATVLGHDENSNLPFAWEIAQEKGGRFIMLGMRWYHSMNEHTMMLSNLMTHCGVESVVKTTNANVWTALRTVGNRSLLFIMNLYSAPMETDITVKPSWSKSEIELGSFNLAPMSVEVKEVQQCS